MDKILIVDDAELNRSMLGAIFEDKFDILYAKDGVEAIELIDEYNFDISIILLDLVMPKLSGLDVLAHMRHKDMLEQLPVIMVTGESNTESDMKAYEYGVADIIYKPYDANIITRRVNNLVEQYSHRKQIEKELELRTAELVKSQKQMQEMNEFLLDALGSVVEFRSLESGAHAKRVRFFTEIILGYVKSNFPEYGLTGRQVELMSQASAIHDVGKIAIPDEILKAPRKLTSDEFEEMKKHTTYGCEILDKFRIVDNELFKYCYDICRWHHEKADGKGYPDGLLEADIPIYCQAVAISDCFDALVSKRVYKGAIGRQEAFDMILRGECGRFSDVIITCFQLAKDEMFSTVEKANEGEKNL